MVIGETHHIYPASLKPDIFVHNTGTVMLHCYTRTIPICDKETFLRTGFHELITWLSPLPDSFLLTTYAALSNTYNNNNNYHCPLASYAVKQRLNFRLPWRAYAAFDHNLHAGRTITVRLEVMGVQRLEIWIVWESSCRSATTLLWVVAAAGSVNFKPLCRVLGEMYESGCQLHLWDVVK